MCVLYISLSSLPFTKPLFFILFLFSFFFCYPLFLFYVNFLFVRIMGIHVERGRNRYPVRGCWLAHCYRSEFRVTLSELSKDNFRRTGIFLTLKISETTCGHFRYRKTRVSHKFSDFFQKMTAWETNSCFFLIGWRFLIGWSSRWGNVIVVDNF